MLGFAMRAGKVIIGTENVCRAMPRGELKAVIISDKASAGTKKKLLTKSEFYGIPTVMSDIDTERLGRLLGKTYAPAAAAVTDAAFAAEIMRAAEKDAEE